jgi:glutaredoxin 3
MSPLTEKLTQIVKNNRVAVFAKSYCPHCNATKASLNAAGVKYHNEDLDKWAAVDMEAAQEYFHATTGARTVPRIYIDGICIGGNSDLQTNYVKSGKIKELAQL